MAHDPAFGEQAARCRASACCACLARGKRQTWRTEPHHEPPIGRDHGTKDRAELDRDTVPLCTACHVERHASGELTFWARVGLSWVYVRDRMRDGAHWSELEALPF